MNIYVFWILDILFCRIDYIFVLWPIDIVLKNPFRITFAIIRWCPSVD